MTLSRQCITIFMFGAVCALLCGCSTLPTWLGGPPVTIKRAAGERVNILSSMESLKPDEAVKDVAIEIPEQANLEQWRNLNDAMLTAHIGLTGVSHEQSVTIGDGNAFVRNEVSSPIVAGALVFAMDASGVVSAHEEANIRNVKWTDATGRKSHVNDALGGGLAYADGVLYATTGMGNVRALDAVTGTVKWSINAGAPVRGAPAVEGGIVVVLTADNQTLALDAATGQSRWEHRGIRETAGYFSNSSPVISEGIIITAYSSGEIFALRLETGNVLWNDTLASSQRGKASAVLGGIDANPIVQDGVVIVTSANGQTQASALLNGRPLWQQRVGGHATPWSAGNALFVITNTHDIAALLKRDGAVRWATSLAVADTRDTSKDKTPPLYGPILSANAILVVDGDGMLTSFKPTTGEKISSYALASGIVTAPVIANGALYVMTKNAKLVKYY